MVAHHADDQAETVLMRLFHARLRSGLQGMKKIEWIPECYGIHGVYHSGGPVPIGDPSLVEHGGIKILRPLLGFEKSRLIATCEKHNTRWAEDKTNQDKSLTLRNALRNIVNNHQLPKALTKESMLSLAQTTRARVQKHQAAAEKLFNSCQMSLDVSVGAVTVRLPPVEALLSDSVSASAPSLSDKLRARNTANYLLERITDLVSPMEKATRESLANAVLTVYPSLAPEFIKIPSQRRQQSFACCKCLWNEAEPNEAESKEAKLNKTELNKWILSRQPPAKKDIEASSITFPPGKMSGWHLFDGRFWVRLRNQNNRDIVLRMVSGKEYEELLHATPKAKLGEYQPPGPEASMYDRRTYMIKALKAVKPYMLRRHLPALFLAPGPTSPEAEPTLIALPTLQSSTKISLKGARLIKCTWDVRYKKVDSGSRPLSDILSKRKEFRVDSDPKMNSRRPKHNRIHARV